MVNKFPTGKRFQRLYSDPLDETSISNIKMDNCSQETITKIIEAYNSASR